MSREIEYSLLFLMLLYFHHFNLIDLGGPYLLTIRSMLLTKKLQAREWPRRLEATETMAPIDSCAKVSSESDRLKTWIQMGTSSHFATGSGSTDRSMARLHGMSSRICPIFECMARTNPRKVSMLGKQSVENRNLKYSNGLM